MATIRSKLTGQDPRDPNSRRGLDQAALQILGRGASQDDDEDVLALEGAFEEGVGGVVAFLDFDGAGEGSRARGAGDGCEGKGLGGEEEGIEDVGAGLAGGANYSDVLDGRHDN